MSPGTFVMLISREKPHTVGAQVGTAALTCNLASELKIT